MGVLVLFLYLKEKEAGYGGTRKTRNLFWRSFRGFSCPRLKI